MGIATDTARCTDAMVENCGLDSASIFLADRSGGRPALSYLYHVGVSEETQLAYADHVFADDPFARPSETFAIGDGGLVRWEDDRLASAIANAPDYRRFIARHGVDVVGAYVRWLAADLCLLIGVHCRPGGHARCDVPFVRLEEEIGGVAALVTAQLLGDVLTTPAGRVGLKQAFDARLAGRSGVPLSRRENEIATLICGGQQNKMIAARTGLSEYTVENYLRRIYRKLGIHNRASLVAMLSGSLH